ncbi:hypothetical protein BDW75DRAFT_149251 [Aspergillus navahoensis]
MASIRTPRARLSHMNRQFPHLTITAPFLQQSHRHRFQYHVRSSHSGKSHNRPSTSAKPNEKCNPPASSSSAISLSEDVNPPRTTRPAELETPAPLDPSASVSEKAQRLVAYGRAYLSFYKTGLKNVYHNYRTSLPIRRSLGIPSYLPTSPPPKFFIRSSSGNSKHVKAKASRSTFQLLNRAAYDVRRMIPFALVLIICGEFTPLLVIAFGNAITPFTCRIPKQIDKYRAQRADRKRAALGAYAEASNRSVAAPEPGSKEELELLFAFASKEFAKEASARDVLTACAVFGLAKSHNRPSLLVEPVYRKRLAKHVEYLAVDDKLIKSSGGVTKMESAEVKIAVEERGGYGLMTGASAWETERAERSWLEMWLQRSQPDAQLLKSGEVKSSTV